MTFTLCEEETSAEHILLHVTFGTSRDSNSSSNYKYNCSGIRYNNKAHCMSSKCVDLWIMLRISQCEYTFKHKYI